MTNNTVIHDQVQRRFARVALDPTSETRFELGRASALKLGYDAAILDALSPAVVESFAGMGNPLALEPLAGGMTVLDLGCGAGVDTMIAARMVGPCGRVIGIDMTDEMVEKARQACVVAGCTNVEIKKGMAHRLDLDDETVDVVVTNGVINLCPDKENVLAEIHRILKPGGRLQAADMALVEGVNPELLERVGEWSD
jgi:arsenite methyltransferase